MKKNYILLIFAILIAFTSFGQNYIKLNSGNKIKIEEMAGY